jgi:hypothetical protein
LKNPQYDSNANSVVSVTILKFQETQNHQTNSNKMSLHFNWSEWSQTELTQQVLTTVNSLLSDLPPNDALAGPVVMTEFSFGSSSPTIELTSINILSLRVQEIEIKFSYNGDGFAKLETMANINKLTSITTVQSPFLRSLSIHRPMVMPVKIHAHGLIVNGSIRIRIERPDDFNFDEATVSIRLLHENPLKQIVITTNFEQDMPDTKDVFDGEVQKGVGQVVADLMANDKVIPIKLNNKK